MELNGTGRKTTKKPTVKQQREEERHHRIEILTEEITALQEEENSLLEKRETMQFPCLTGTTVSHAQYGGGKVTAQDGAVITVAYDVGSKRQKLPFVILSGLIELEDEGAVDLCREINALEQEISKIKREISFRSGEIEDLKKAK